MSRGTDKEAWEVVARVQDLYLGNRDAKTVDETVEMLKAHGLLIGSTSDEDRDRLEKIRERDIQKRVAENKGIMQGRREMMNVAFLLDYIDKLERRNNDT